ncbi:MAG: hypothetical protein EOP51_02455 [Sphingobacteriales bacterium]|nr:MAG: hypothetical protein EOP51_02455 [Sphingobacteriales bacterium]
MYLHKKQVTMNNHTVSRTIQINAPKEAVWDALTNPEKTKEYFFHCEVLSDWQKGSTITFKGKMFWVINVELTGEILDIHPGNLLKYTLTNGHNKDDNPNNFSTITDSLTEHNGVTTLSILDDVGSAEGFEERVEKSEQGWDKVLKGLKKLVEEGS